MSMTPIPVRQVPAPTEGINIDRGAVLTALGLNPNSPNTHALLLVCERYNLDPLLKHMVLIKTNPYVTRDGYLAIAHRSGQFDGMEVLEQGETPTHYTAKVAVYRRDMSRPFAYVGRFPKNKDMAKEYGPEMAVKVAEVQALRRAFNVTGIGAADEQWDDAPAAAPGSAGEEYPPFTEENETLVHPDQVRQFCIDMGGAFPALKAKELDGLRHAIVHYATKGRTDSSKAAMATEWPAVLAVYKWFVEAKLALVDTNDGPRLVKDLDKAEAAS